jgi:hypothetical protein
MFKKLLLLTAVLVMAFAVTSSAKDLTGRFGLGYYESQAPVGIRYWVNEKVGIDGGLGFQSEDGFMEFDDQGQPTGETTSATRFWVSAGVPYVVFPTDRANFMFRPGVLFGVFDEDYYDPKTRVLIQLHLVAEVFFGDHFSLEAAHGVNIDMQTPADDDADSMMDFGTASGSITQLGFHFYF